jgi:hypothetical protein
MKSQFNPPPDNVPDKTRLAPGQVMIQWKCRGDHPDCAARTWKDYLPVAASDAQAQLKYCNQGSHYFDFRIRP